MTDHVIQRGTRQLHPEVVKDCCSTDDLQGWTRTLTVRWVTVGSHFCDTLRQRTVAASPPLTNAPGRWVGAASVTRALSDVLVQRDPA